MIHSLLSSGRFCLSVCLSGVCLSVCLSVCRSVGLSTRHERDAAEGTQDDGRNQEKEQESKTPTEAGGWGPGDNAIESAGEGHLLLLLLQVLLLLGVALRIALRRGIPLLLLIRVGSLLHLGVGIILGVGRLLLVVLRLLLGRRSRQHLLRRLRLEVGGMLEGQRRLLGLGLLLRRLRRLRQLLRMVQRRLQRR